MVLTNNSTADDTITAAASTPHTVVSARSQRNDDGAAAEFRHKTSYADVIKFTALQSAALTVVSNELSDRSKRSHNLEVSGLPNR
jgi:hypothetical protein